jgi:hypothetical protein
LTFTLSIEIGGWVRLGRLEYKWVALSNTTLGMLMATINFRGIPIDPLAPGNTSYLLWVILGFLVVIAVLLGAGGGVAHGLGAGVVDVG